jgi:phage FluMu protein Com
MKQEPKNYYRCSHCGKVVLRKSDRKWIQWICEKTGRNARLILKLY